MNYSTLYNSIISRAKSRQLEGYVEKHHIVPKCLGGDNSKENIVALTAKEHFIAHLLLCEIHRGNNKLLYAAYAMCQQNKTKKRYIPSSRVYQRLKQEVQKEKLRQTTIICSNCGKENSRINSHVRPVANYCNRECYLSAGRKGRALATGNIHIHKNGEVKFINKTDLVKYTGWQIGRPGFNKAVICLDKDTLEEVQDYDKMEDAIRDGFNVSGISRCVHGYIKTHKGYVWKLKNAV
jgi:hypothetical protein